MFSMINFIKQFRILIYLLTYRFSAIVENLVHRKFSAFNETNPCFALLMADHLS